MASSEDPLLGSGSLPDRPLPEGVSDARAIERVLAAERDAERAVADAAKRSEQLLADAREHARRIGERADARVKRLHALASVRAESAIRELGVEYEDRARESERSLTDETLLAGAVARVADWLLGEEGEP